MQPGVSNTGLLNGDQDLKGSKLDQLHSTVKISYGDPLLT